MTALADYDIVQLHRLMLGRDPGEADIAGRRGQTLIQLLTEFAGSTEVRLNLQGAVQQGRLPAGPAWRAPVGATSGWAAVALPLEDGARPSVAAARNWSELHARLFADAAFAREIEGFNPGLAAPAFTARLAAAAAALDGRALAAEVELFGREHTRGWAADLAATGERITVDLLADGEPIARSEASLFRRDVQDALGGDGRCGFVLEVEGGAERLATATTLAVRDARSGLILAAERLTAAPKPGAVERLLDEVAEARRALAWLERRARDLSAAAVFPVEEYGRWALAYGVETPHAEHVRATRAARLAVRPGFSILVSPADHPLDHAPLLGALARQGWEAWEAVICATPARREETASLIAALEPSTRGRCRIVEVEAADEEAALTRALGEAAFERIVLLAGGDTLAVDALHRFATALQTSPGPILVYGDDDRFILREGRPAFTGPRLRGAFDPDLLLQDDATGPVFALDRAALLTALAAGARLAVERRRDLVLRVLERTGPAGLRHIPGVVAHLREGGPAARLADLGAEAETRARHGRETQAHILRVGLAAAVSTPARDRLGAPLGSGVTVRPPLPAGVTATIMIPTRDRLDLLKPCLAGLEAHRGDNRTAMEVVVIDNASAEPDTLDFLRREEAAGRIVLLTSDAPFNFAALNNLAARRATADVLVMLNNDIEVLAPDWLDALVRHAMRPEIGAVGARLLYGDGTVQHAGVVTGGHDAFTAHEGVGAQGADPGYLFRHLRTRRVAAVTGACLATRRELWERLGGLDAARFAVDGNDMDYCLRLRAAGLAVLYAPDCTLFHHESKSRGFNAKSEAARARGEAEAARLRERWGAELAADPWYPPAFDRGAPPFQRLGPPPSPG